MLKINLMRFFAVASAVLFATLVQAQQPNTLPLSTQAESDGHDVWQNRQAADVSYAIKNSK